MPPPNRNTEYNPDDPYGVDSGNSASSNIARRAEQGTGQYSNANAYRSGQQQQPGGPIDWGTPPLPRHLVPDGAAPRVDPYWDGLFKSLYGERVAPVGYNTTNQDQARLAQLKVMQDLQRQAAGDPNSRAQQALGSAFQEAQAQQSSLGSTMRGQSAGAAMRGVQAGQQDIQRGMAGDRQALMLQEQQAAQAMLAQLLAQQQGQDITQAQGMASGQLQGQAQIDEYYRNLMGGALDSGIAGQQNALNTGLARNGYNLESNKIDQGLYQDLIRSAATATQTAGTAFADRGGGGSSYRQVDGQASIVPYWDK